MDAKLKQRLEKIVAAFADFTPEDLEEGLRDATVLEAAEVFHTFLNTAQICGVCTEDSVRKMQQITGVSKESSNLVGLVTKAVDGIEAVSAAVDEIVDRLQGRLAVSSKGN